MMLTFTKLNSLFRLASLILCPLTAVHSQNWTVGQAINLSIIDLPVDIYVTEACELLSGQEAEFHLPLPKVEGIQYFVFIDHAADSAFSFELRHENTSEVLSLGDSMEIVTDGGMETVHLSYAGYESYVSLDFRAIGTPQTAGQQHPCGSSNNGWFNQPIGCLYPHFVDGSTYLTNCEVQPGALEPVIYGDSLLCPNSGGTLSTQAFDSYQWYRRYFGSTQSEPIPGATGQTLEMDYFNYAASFMSVKVTQAGTVYTSEEFFVDGLVFLPPVVQTTGDFTIGPQGETIVCPGDTVFFTLMNPYATNITWYQNGQSLPENTGQVLAVTDPGTYWVQGAPALCPQYIQGLGVDLVVEACTTDSREAPTLEGVVFFPNPVSQELYVSPTGALSGKEVSLFNSSGQRVFAGKWPSDGGLNLGSLESGSYWLVWDGGHKFVAVAR